MPTSSAIYETISKTGLSCARVSLMANRKLVQNILIISTILSAGQRLPATALLLCFAGVMRNFYPSISNWMQKILLPLNRSNVKLLPLTILVLPCPAIADSWKLQAGHGGYNFISRFRLL